MKVCFAPDIHADEAIHEIQFGHIRRPNHASRQFDADRFEVCNHKWTALAEEGRGFAVLNDCKYGVNVVGKSINLTLLRAPLGPDMTADKGTQEFVYATCPWIGSFADSSVVRDGYELNVPALTAPGAAGERSLLSVDAPNVVIETIKQAEDGQGIIVRLYESQRRRGKLTLTTGFPLAKAWRANLLEENQERLDCADNRVAIFIKPYQILTLRLLPHLFGEME